MVTFIHGEDESLVISKNLLILSKPDGIAGGMSTPEIVKLPLYALISNVVGYDATVLLRNVLLRESVTPIA